MPKSFPIGQVVTSYYRCPSCTFRFTFISTCDRTPSKTRILPFFHKCQETRRTRESKPSVFLRSFLKKRKKNLGASIGGSARGHGHFQYPMRLYQCWFCKSHTNQLVLVMPSMAGDLQEPWKANISPLPAREKNIKYFVRCITFSQDNGKNFIGMKLHPITAST